MLVQIEEEYCCYTKVPAPGAWGSALGAPVAPQAIYHLVVFSFLPRCGALAQLEPREHPCGLDLQGL